MKKFMRTVIASALMLLMLSTMMFTAFAADNATVCGVEAKVGSTVTYTFNITSKQQNVCGFDMRFFFDQAVLELQEVSNGELSGVVVNDNKNGDGRILMNASFLNGQEGFECKEKTEFAKLTFKVLKAEETDITYYVPYLYDFDDYPIYDYKFTVDIGVDGEVAAEDKVPALEDVSKLDNVDAGDFPNNAEGTGSGEKPVITKPAAADDNSDSSSGTADGGESNNRGVVIGIVCGVIVVAAIVVLVVVKSKSDKTSEGEGEDNTADDSLGDKDAE